MDPTLKVVLITIGFLVVSVGMFLGTYILNKRTPKPEGCENMEECEGCQMTSCSHYINKEDTNEKKEG